VRNRKVRSPDAVEDLGECGSLLAANGRQTMHSPASAIRQSALPMLDLLD
jgi:hypothetical protein